MVAGCWLLIVWVVIGELVTIGADIPFFQEQLHFRLQFPSPLTRHPWCHECCWVRASVAELHAREVALSPKMPLLLQRETLS